MAKSDGFHLGANTPRHQNHAFTREIAHLCARWSRVHHAGTIGGESAAADLRPILTPKPPGAHRPMTDTLGPSERIRVEALKLASETQDPQPPAPAPGE